MGRAAVGETGKGKKKRGVNKGKNNKPPKEGNGYKRGNKAVKKV